MRPIICWSQCRKAEQSAKKAAESENDRGYCIGEVPRGVHLKNGHEAEGRKIGVAPQLRILYVHQIDCPNTSYSTDIIELVPMDLVAASKLQYKKPQKIIATTNR